MIFFCSSRPHIISISIEVRSEPQTPLMKLHHQVRWGCRHLLFTLTLVHSFFFTGQIIDRRSFWQKTQFTGIVVPLLVHDFRASKVIFWSTLLTIKWGKTIVLISDSQASKLSAWRPYWLGTALAASSKILWGSVSGAASSLGVCKNHTSHWIDQTSKTSELQMLKSLKKCCISC